MYAGAFAETSLRYTEVNSHCFDISKNHQRITLRLTAYRDKRNSLCCKSEKRE